MVERGLESLGELEDLERQESGVLSEVRDFQGVDLLTFDALLDPSLGGLDFGGIAVESSESAPGVP